MRKQISIFLILSILASLAGCGQMKSTDLMDNVTQNEVPDAVITGDEKVKMNDFAIRLFQNSLMEEKNTLISPLSVFVALSMTANGAGGNTLSQMEEVLGMPVKDLNAYVRAYMEKPSDEKNQLSLADSIWFTDEDAFTVSKEFLQTNADYYGAGVYEAAFDKSTCKDINLWVEENTDGMIKDILDEIPEHAVMYLVNALAFEAEWAKAYEKSQVRDAVFTKEDGTKQDVELMYSSEYQYLEDENATGFIKYYKGNRYAFAALLPEKGMSLAEYAGTLNGEKLHAMISEPEGISVDVAIPKFETEYDIEMSEVLKRMGMVDAFDDGLADFTKLGTHSNGNIWINRVLHKTFISVAEKGTKAGAATVVEMVTESAMMEPEESKEVILNRPFVYMLIDCEEQIPFFIGTVMNIEK